MTKTNMQIKRQKLRALKKKLKLLMDRGYPRNDFDKVDVDCINGFLESIIYIGKDRKAGCIVPDELFKRMYSLHEDALDRAFIEMNEADKNTQQTRKEKEAMMKK
jgi:hypothetical protein